MYFIPVEHYPGYYFLVDRFRDGHGVTPYRAEERCGDHYPDGYVPRLLQDGSLGLPLEQRGLLRLRRVLLIRLRER